MVQTRLFILACAWCCALVHTTAMAALSPKELLQDSASFFDKGQYQKALEQLSSVDIRADFDNSDDMKLAFKIRAVAYEQTGDRARSCETIRELYFLDPNYQFNPFDTPKSVVELAKIEKAAIDEKSQHLATIKNDLRHESQTAPSGEGAIIIDKPPPFQNTFFPFGLNHFYFGSPMKGSIYLSSQSLGLITNIAAFWAKQAYLPIFGSSHLKDGASSNGFQMAQTLQYIGLGTFVLSYVVSVIDALIQLQSTSSEKFASDQKSSSRTD